MTTNPDNPEKLPFPETVLIGAIEYRISESEGLIVFTQTINVWGTYTRMAFHKPKYALWQFSFKDSSGDVAACHVVKAYEIVEKYRGDNWGKFPQESRPQEKEKLVELDVDKVREFIDIGNSKGFWKIGKNEQYYFVPELVKHFGTRRVDVGELTATLRQYFPCQHHAVNNCRCDIKWAECAKALKAKWQSGELS